MEITDMGVAIEPNFLAYVSIVISIVSVIITILLYRSNVIHDRKRDTLDAYNLLQKEVFDNLNKYSSTEINRIASKPLSDEYKDISGYIARIEHFCVGVNQGIYDFATLYQLAHGYLDSNTISNRIEPVIKRKNKNGREDYYSNIHKVVIRMKSYKT